MQTYQIKTRIDNRCKFDNVSYPSRELAEYGIKYKEAQRNTTNIEFSIVSYSPLHKLKWHTVKTA